MERTSREKLKIGEIISDSIKVYKNNFVALLTLSFIYVLLANVGNIFIALSKIASSEGYFSAYMVGIMLAIILGLVAMIYNIRVGAAIELSVRDTYMNESVCAKESYKKSEGLIGKIFGTSLCVGLMMIIPVLMIVLGISSEIGVIGKVVIVGLGGISTIIINVKFGFSPIIAALYPGLDSYFTRSSNIVNGHFISVIIINLLSSLGVFANLGVVFALGLISSSYMSQIVASILSNIITFLYVPFQISLFVITILKLTSMFIGEEKKDITLEEEA